VLMARWSHSDSIPNSAVKRLCGHDTWRVASWDNSSVPGFSLKDLLLNLVRGLLANQSKSNQIMLLPLPHVG
jgi:hypothetical protein